MKQDLIYIVVHGNVESRQYADVKRFLNYLYLLLFLQWKPHKIGFKIAICLLFTLLKHYNICWYGFPKIELQG